MSNVVHFKRELGGYANLEEVKQQAKQSWLSPQTMPTEVVDALVFELEMLQAERKAIQNNERVLTCVYCGHLYPPGTPPSNHAALEEHIKTCPSHPLSKALEEIRRLKTREVILVLALESIRTVAIDRADDVLVEFIEQMFALEPDREKD